MSKDKTSIRLNVTGRAMWAKVFEENRDLTGWNNSLVDVGGQTKITVVLDEENAKKFKASKSGKSLKPSEEYPGQFEVTLTRKWKDKYSTGGPEVLHEDLTPWVFSEDGPIGNGSLVEVNFQTYETPSAYRGTRLMAVRVLEHVPFEGGTRDPMREDEGYSSKEPEVKKPTKNRAKQEEMDDAIPF